MLEFTIENKNPIEINIENKKLEMNMEISNQLNLDIELLSKGTDYGPTMEEYMRLSDYAVQNLPIDENNYTEKDIKRCQQLFNFYKGMEE